MSVPDPADDGVFRREALEHHAKRDHDTGALLQLATHRPARRSVPFVQQLAETECGAACLAMTLRFWGKDVSLDRIREILGPGRDGLTALALKNAASTFGLRARAVRLDLDELEYLD